MLTVPQTKSMMRLVDALADCRGADPIKDADVAPALCDLLGVDFIGVAYWNHRNAAYDDAYCHGRDACMFTDYEQHYQALDPIGFGRRCTGEATTHIHTLVPPIELERSEYYNDFLVRHGTTEGINASLYAEGRYLTDIRFWRGPSRSLLGAHECRLVDLLRPYLRAALVRHRRPGIPARVTAGEARVAALVARGLSDKQIAARLGISYWTVRTHVAALFGKSGCRNRVGFAAWFRDGGAAPREAQLASRNVLRPARLAS